LEQRFQVLADLIGQVLRGRDPEAIHDMRVASRRLQEALAVAASAARQHPPQVVQQLRRLRRALGTVRDLDVQLQLLREIAAELPRGERPRVRLLRQLIGSRRGRQVGKMRTKLGKVDLPQLVAALQAEVERLGRTQAVSVERALRLHMRARRLELARASVRARSTWDENDLHATRISAKRLRYALELGEALHPDAQQAAIKALKRLQNLLGEWHDLVVLDQTLMRNLGKQRLLRERLDVARTVLDLIGRVRDKKRGKVEDFCAASARRPRS
jgi:CHAD domain-containing protein